MTPVWSTACVCRAGEDAEEGFDEEAVAEELIAAAEELGYTVVRLLPASDDGMGADPALARHLHRRARRALQQANAAAPSPDDYDDQLKEEKEKARPTVAEADGEKGVCGDTVFFRVEGMTCASCVAMIENVVRHLPAVTHVSVSLMTEEAEVAYVPHAGTSPDTIREAMADLGFTVTCLDKAVQGKATLLVEGMHCASCVSKIETALLKHPAITNASVNNVTKQAKV